MENVLKIWQVTNLHEQKFVSFQCFLLMTLKIKYNTGEFSTPSQINVLNLTVNFSEANKNPKVFLIGGY